MPRKNYQRYKKVKLKQRGITDVYKVCQMCQAACCKPHLTDTYFHLPLQADDVLNFIRFGLRDLIDLSSIESFIGVQLPLFRISNHVFGYCPFLDYSTSACKIYKRPYMSSTCKLFPYWAGPVNELNDHCLLSKKLAPRTYKIQDDKAKKLLAKMWKRELTNTREYLDVSYRLLPRTSYDTWGWVVNKYGSFYFDNPKLIKPFTKLLDTYARFIKVKELIIMVKVLDNLNRKVNTFTGVYGKKELVNPNSVAELINKKTDEADSNVLDPRVLFGVVYEEELLNHPIYWRDCWNKKIRAWLRANS